MSIIMVIIYHLTPFYPQGFLLGVDIFFALSGFLVTNSLLTGLNKNEKLSYENTLGFYKKRAARIYPVLCIYVFIVLVVYWAILPFPGEITISGLMSLLGASNFYLSSLANGYFTNLSQLNPFLVTWSLSIELQFYFLLPFLICISMRLQKWIGQYSFLYLFCGISFIAYLGGDSNWYMNTLPRIWELFLGSIAYIHRKKLANLLKLLPVFNSTRKSTIIIVIVATSYFLPLGMSIARVAIVFFTTIFLIKIFDNTGGDVNVSKNSIIEKLLVLIGNRSYSLFLWHFGVSTFLKVVGLWSSDYRIIYGLVATAIISELSYRTLECRGYSFDSKKTIEIIVRLISPLSVIAGVTALITLMNRNFLLQASTKVLPSAYLATFPLNKSVSELKQLKNLKFARKGEYLHIDRNVRDLGHNQKRIVYFLGDSHVYNHVPSVIAALEEFSSDLIFVKVDGSPFDHDQGVFNGFNGNNSWHHAISQVSKSSKKGDLLIFSTDIADIKDPSTGKFSSEKINQLDVAIKAIAEVADNKKLSLFLVDVLPIPCLNIGTINNALHLEEKKNFFVRNASDCSYPLSELEQFKMPLSDVYSRASGMSSKVEYIDFSGSICRDNICDPLDKKGQLMFMDQSPHIALENMLFLKDVWKEVLLNSANHYLHLKDSD